MKQVLVKSSPPGVATRCRERKPRPGRSQRSMFEQGQVGRSGTLGPEAPATRALPSLPLSLPGAGSPLTQRRFPSPRTRCRSQLRRDPAVLASTILGVDGAGFSKPGPRHPYSLCRGQVGKEGREGLWEGMSLSQVQLPGHPEAGTGGAAREGERRGCDVNEARPGSRERVLGAEPGGGGTWAVRLRRPGVRPARLLRRVSTCLFAGTAWFPFSVFQGNPNQGPQMDGSRAREKRRPFVFPNYHSTNIYCPSVGAVPDWQSQG